MAQINYDPSLEDERCWPPQPLMVEEIESLVRVDSWGVRDWRALHTIRTIRLYLFALERLKESPVAANQIESDLDWLLWGSEARQITDGDLLNPMYELLAHLQEVWPRIRYVGDGHSWDATIQRIIIVLDGWEANESNRRMFAGFPHAH